MALSPRERKAALVLKGIKQADIARRLGVAPTHVSDVVYGRRRSVRVETAIAEALGQPAPEVFPTPANAAQEGYPA